MSEMTPRESPRILIVDDEPANLDLLHRCLEKEGYIVHVARDGERALALAARTSLDAILLDVGLPGMDGFEVCRCLMQDPRTRHVPVIFITARDESARADAFRAGGVDYIAKPFEESEVRARVRVHIDLAGMRAELDRRMAELDRLGIAKQAADARAEAVTRRESDQWGIGAIIGRSAAINTVRDDLARLRGSDVGVLITGESGTGKELVARALHLESRRASGPFIAINCAAIPAELAESVLFGHAKGAFSGAAADHAGYFAQANGGTLFLDEVGAMPIELQPKLLRALEEQRVDPVGGSQSVAVDVRVIAATNADPAREIDSGRLRADLYFRLARFTVSLPPLRERENDIALLAEHFLERFAREMGRPRPAFEDDALAQLLTYSFPGNVRELRNMMEHALLRSRDGTIALGHIHFLAAAVDPVLAVSVDDDDPAAALFAYLATRSSLTNTQARKLLAIDARRASYLLARLVRDGRLVREGARRWTRYALPDA